MTNPICGDRVRIDMILTGDRIVEIGFAAKSCAICSASTSLMSEMVKGVDFKTALKFSQSFEEQILAPLETVWPDDLATLECFAHLRVNPSRRGCALLPWIAVKAAFAGLV